MQPTKDSIKAWLKANSHSRDWLGEQLNVGKRTVDAWLSTSANIPAAKLAFIERLMQDDETSDTLDIPTQSTIVLNPSQESLDAWSQAFKSSNAATLSEWAVESLNAFAANQSAFTEIIHSIEQDAIAAGFLPDPAPEREILRVGLYGYAAAGKGYQNPETATYDTEIELPPSLHKYQKRGIYAVQVVGDSMLPKYQDGQTIFIIPATGAENGQPVVALLPDGSNVLKIYKRTDHTSWLESRNRDKYPEEIEKFQLRGIVVHP